MSEMDDDRLAKVAKMEIKHFQASKSGAKVEYQHHENTSTLDKVEYMIL